MSVYALTQSKGHSIVNTGSPGNDGRVRLRLIAIAGMPGKSGRSMSSKKNGIPGSDGGANDSAITIAGMPGRSGRSKSSRKNGIPGSVGSARLSRIAMNGITKSHRLTQ